MIKNPLLLFTVVAMSANQTHWSAPAINVINTYYRRDDILIGSSRTDPNPEEWYHETVPDYPHNLASGNDWDSVRKT